MTKIPLKAYPLRLPEKMQDKLKKKAAKEYISLNSYILQLLQKDLDEK